MREALARHAGAVLAAAVLLVIAGSVGLAVPPPDGVETAPVSPFPKTAIALPGPDEDADRDSYPDGADRAEGDLLLELELVQVRLARPASPYLVAGTQDDQWRTGAGAELEWRHVVDFDPLGLDPGSPAWREDALRTGSWVVTQPAVAGGRAFGTGTSFPPDEGLWPQRLVLNVRDDRAQLHVSLELRDAGASPHAMLGRWDVVVDLEQGNAATGAGSRAREVAPLGEPLALEDKGTGLTLRVHRTVDLPLGTKQQVAQRWAPILHFDGGEAFFPVPGGALERYHGFAQQRPDLRTWDLDFNNGRDRYRLLLADFTGDRRVDRHDAIAMTDLLSASPVAPPTVHAHVARAHGGAVVVQYWMLYFYNFLPDEQDVDIPIMGHSGDRELIQLRFASLDDARFGRPVDVAYSQHYGGILVPVEGHGLPPFHDDVQHPALYVGRGGHASYPVAGDNRRVLPPFTGFYDRFDGQGPTWTPADYHIDVLGNQTWHMGYLWGPATRHSRDLGISLRPLLGHDFRYPLQDPLWWAEGLERVAPEDLEALYGVPA